ncbi:E3 ubiquitin-protein ligase MARCH3-like [Stegodyphus dumicola]|uniref:E3 ubiquitin-protein ligase MARCH3-like n=1 Tax=Stegodyphus dumicola TaxID=202533 RepID=UPI0015AAFFDC|nr:E3 ubiquitin-protein ligase MARCH3-like [Stegodyphus dumicola]
MANETDSETTDCRAGGSRDSAVVTFGSEQPDRCSVVLKVSDLENSPMCRICYNGNSRERLLKPCQCKGTIKYVHRNCLERWLESTNCETCELCHFHFHTKRTRKSFWDWCRQPETQNERRNFLGDFACFAFLTPLGIATFWLCAEGAIYYQKVKNSTLETVALVILALFLVFAYLTWITLCSRYHLTIWNRWRDHNWNVRIVDRTGRDGNVEDAQETAINIPLQSSEDLLRPIILPPELPIRNQPEPTLPRDESPMEPTRCLPNFRLLYTSRTSNV